MIGGVWQLCDWERPLQHHCEEPADRPVCIAEAVIAVQHRHREEKEVAGIEGKNYA